MNYCNRCGVAATGPYCEFCLENAVTPAAALLVKRTGVSTEEAMQRLFRRKEETECTTSLDLSTVLVGGQPLMGFPTPNAG